MEFPTLGENCMKEDCNDLDFLPIKCHFCGDFFCAKHFLPEDHQCKKYESKCATITGMPLLPIQLQWCNVITMSQSIVFAYLDKTIQKYLCCVPGCKRSELAPVTCLHCSIVICLQHRCWKWSLHVTANFIFLFGRHQQDHDCPKLVLPQKSMTATKAVVDEILSSAPAPPKTEKKVRSVKAQKTAAKVQLMKLKMKSIGDKSLPQEERIYFLVSVHYLYFTSSKYYSFELKV